MKYPVEIDSVVMIYISNIIWTGSSTKKVDVWGEGIETKRGHGVSISLLLFFSSE